MSMYITFPSWIQPEVFSNLPIRWYSLMYLVAFAFAYILFRYQRNKGLIAIDDESMYSLFLYAIVGLIVGARLFSTLFYDGSMYYWTHPHMIFWPFRGGHFVGLPGMSYHGGLVGAVIGVLIFSKQYKQNFLDIADVMVAAVPLGYTFGRLGNFINGELWGRVSTVKWAIVFPDAPRFSTNYGWVRDIANTIGMEFQSGQLLNLPRHPSQLYEALFEGIVLWLFMWFIIKPRKKFPGYNLSWYLIGYGGVRFLIEYLREPDSQLGFIISWGKESEPIALFHSLFNISMGQVLCLLMIIAGVVGLLLGKKKHKGALHG